MARKRTPDTSTITRPRPVAYARKQKPGGAGEGAGEDPDADDTKPDAKARPDDAADAKPEPVAVKDDATQPTRARVDTVGMPDELALGTPPPMPVAAPVIEPASPSAVSARGTESPTKMPGPREIPGGDPGDPAAAPGAVPPGDSRSLRRRAAAGEEFALIYRLTNAVITRFGPVGTRGQWRVVEYPTTASASHAYAKECSRFVSEGFSDYRE